MAMKRLRGSNKARGVCKLAIDQDMTIYAIENLKQGLSEEMDSYDRFELDLSDVEEFDSAGIQLLLALKSELMRKDKNLKLTAVSIVVVELMASYGLRDAFNVRGAA